MERCFRPFDELDKARLDAWETAAMLRPRIAKATEPKVPASSLRQFLAELSDSDDESTGAPLSITDGQIEAGSG